MNPVGREGAISIEDGSGLVDREKLDERAAKLSGVALLRARRALAGLTGSTLDETSGIRLVARALGYSQPRVR
jgi:chaperonin GroEL